MLTTVNTRRLGRQQIRGDISKGITFSGITLRHKRKKGKIRTFPKKNPSRDFFPTASSHGAQDGMLAKAELWQLARVYSSPFSKKTVIRADCLQSEANR